MDPPIVADALTDSLSPIRTIDVHELDPLITVCPNTDKEEPVTSPLRAETEEPNWTLSPALARPPTNIVPMTLMSVNELAFTDP
jgi:hypothetical protein